MSEDSNNQLEEILIALRMAVKKDDEETVDALKKQLLELASVSSNKNLANNLRSLMPKEKLPVQWEIEEVIDILDPPKEKEIEEDDPSQRQLRSSEITPIYQDPRGLSIFASKVDGRWVVMQMDPRSGGMHRQEIPEDRVAQIKASIPPTSPYWLVDPMTL